MTMKKKLGGMQKNPAMGLAKGKVNVHWNEGASPQCPVMFGKWLDLMLEDMGEHPRQEVITVPGKVSAFTHKVQEVLHGAMEKVGQALNCLKQWIVKNHQAAEGHISSVMTMR